MSSSMGEKLKRAFIRAGVEIMPYIPLPEELYRKILVRDSEKRYASGRWTYMKDVAESHRYSLIVGCCEYYTSHDRKILDVGCGEGILQQRITYSSYVGVDMNAEAIKMAKGREDDRSVFVLAPAESYQPKSLFDVIVFNESLYYIPTPIEVFKHYRALLAPYGIIIVCMFQTNLARRIWKRLANQGMTELTTVKISNELGFASKVKVYANSQLGPQSK
jgi:2-polyprenyl-3-methyl-5-hydroxy-6-metoxy-1,4-benzoquinol methylase